MGQSARSNLDIVKGGYAAWMSGDVDRIVQDYSDDVEVRPFLGEPLGASVYRGRDGVRRWYSDANDAWDRLDVTTDEFVELGEVVLVGLRAVGVGKGSHAEVEARIWHVIELRDGAVVRLRGYGDRDAALEAAGAVGQRADAGQSP